MIESCTVGLYVFVQMAATDAKFSDDAWYALLKKMLPSFSKVGAAEVMHFPAWLAVKVMHIYSAIL